MTAADIQPERVLRVVGRRDHFLVRGEKISILLRSFLVPIPPTAKIWPLCVTTPADLRPTLILPEDSQTPLRRENL